MGAFGGGAQPVGSREGVSCIRGGGGGRRTMGRWEYMLAGGSRTIGELSSGLTAPPDETRVGRRVACAAFGELEEGRVTF